MSIDLTGLTAKQLSSLISNAQKQHAKVSRRAPIGAVRSKIVKYAKNEGYTIAELFGAPAGAGTAASGRGAAKKTAAKKVRKLGKVAPKYRNPANTKETWSGRGKQPRWLASLVAKGKKPEDFLIKKK